MSKGPSLAQVQTELAKTQAELAALKQTYQLLNSTLDPETLIVQILESLSLVVKHDSASIFLMEDEQHARFRYGVNYDQTTLEFLTQTRLEVSGFYTLNYMTQHRAPICVPDTFNDPNWIRPENSPNVRSYIGAPILLGEELIGFLNADSRHPNALSPADADRLLSFATQAAIAIRNARLFDDSLRQAMALERRTQLLEALNTLSNETLLEEDKIYQTALEAAVVLLECHGGAFLQTGPGGDWEAKQHYQQVVGAATPLGDWLQSRTAEDWAWLGEVGSHQQFEYQSKIWLLGGLWLEGQVQGVFAFWDARPARSFEAEELDTMKSIIRQAARSLSQSRLIRALKESQSRNAALIATIPDNIYLITPDGTYLEVFINDGSPLDPGRMIGKDIRKFSPTEVWQKGLEYVELAMQTGKVQIYDYSLVLPHDQQRHFFESRVAVIRERNEVVLIVRDITERRRFLQALSRRNQLLETLNELSQVALAHLEEGPILNNLARLAGQAIEATSAYICKWEAETYSYIVLSDYISAEANEQERKSDTGVSYTLAPDLQVKGEAWPLSPSGYALIERNDPSISPFHRQHLEEYNGQRILTVLLRVEGQPIGFIEVWDSRPERRISQTDIDTLMTIARQVSLSISSTRLYQALRESESKKSAIINAWPDLMFHMNREGVYLDAKVPSHSPLTREQLIGHQAAEFLDQEVAAMTMYQIEKALETGQVQFYEYQIAEYYGVRDYESRMVKCAEDEALALVRDITDRKRYEKELAQARDAALESSRTKSQFLANMSHELRTPLNSIINYTQLLLDGIYGDISSTQRDRMEKVLRNGRNLLSLVNDVLDLSKIEAGQMRLNRRLVEVDEFIASLMALFKPLAQEKNLNLDYLPPAVPPPALYVDEIRARQVLTNVIGNAIKFTHEGGVTLRCFMEAEGLCMSVTDTGIGIPAEAQSHIFDEFRQVDNSSTRQYEGTGLGLTISRRIVEMHGGSIRLESTLGSGTTFYITFPLADKEALEKDKAGEEAVQA